MTQLFSTCHSAIRLLASCAACAAVLACGSSDSGQSAANGGSGPTNNGQGGAPGAAGGQHAGSAGSTSNSAGSGGSANGGGANGGAANGGAANGGAANAGATSAGSANGGGSGNGGSSNGGAANAGASHGGSGNGGAANGGSSNGGAANSGPGGVAGHGGNAGSSGAAGSGGSTSTHTGVWRIMPLGDSITGTTCGPQSLSKELKDKGHTNFIFVGSNLNNQSCNGAPNVQTEGHGGYLVTDLVGNGQHASELPQWCSSDKADIVLMHFGTNDVWNNIAPTPILSAYSTVLADLRAVNSHVTVFVAQIIPMHPAGCDACETRVEALNAQIPAWATSNSTANSPIYVVDQHSVFNQATYTPSSTYTADGVHPNAAGGQLMADKWYAALTAQSLP